MQRKRQALRMRCFDTEDALKQGAQGGKRQQRGQAPLEMRRFNFIAVMPVQRGANVEMPAQAIIRHIPVMRQIARRLTAVAVKSRQT